MLATSVLSLIAVLMLIVSVSQFSASVFDFARGFQQAKRRRARDLKQLRQDAEVARLNSELQTAATASSLQWRVMEVAEVVDESADCRSFFLVDPHRQALPPFHPGQHLMVRPALAGAYQAMRCYSLSSVPDARYWRITVKRQDPPVERSRRNRGGLSDWLHRTIGVGDCLLIGGPNGQFFLPPESTRPIVLLAAGVGITPMASMLRWSLEHTPQRPVALLYQARDRQHWPLGNAVHQWQTGFQNCRVQSYLSRGDAAELRELQATLSGEFVHGKFSSDEAIEAIGHREADYFMCGPDAWMQSLRAGLLQAGVVADCIHWESFGTPSVEPSQGDGTSTTCSVPVRFEHSGVDVNWTDSKQSLWELARAHEIEIPSGCLSGVCGSCRVKVLAGSVAYDREVKVELSDDECLACIAHPCTEASESAQSGLELQIDA